MNIVLAVIAIFSLFYLLGKVAGLVVKNSTLIAEEFSLPLPLLGIFLGILTTVPEFSLGISSLERSVPDLAAGNLLGGIFVALSLVLAFNLLFNREVKTDGNWHSLVPLAVYLMLPVALGFDGYYGYYDSLILIAGYLAWIIATYFNQSHGFKIHLNIINKKKLALRVLYVFAGVAAILLLSDLIVRLSLFLVELFDIHPFLVGVIIFSIGTNLPEISIAVSAVKRSASSLSFSHLSGSAAANPLCLGVLGLSGFLKTGSSAVAFWSYGLLLLALLLSLLYFYRSGKKLSRSEGWILLIFYSVFAGLQYLFR